MMAKTRAMISLDQARMLVAHLEHGEFELADELLAEVCAPNAADLFEKVGQLTRQLHDSLQEFRLDPRIPDLATHDIPDARERLSYVIDMTDKAANRTMDAVEASLPIADRLNDNIQLVMPNWNALMSRDMSVGQFKSLCHQLDDFIKASESDADKLRQLLTEILMAQDFQDLTGQMIRKVIKLVQEVETKLIEMLTMFGEASAEHSTRSIPVNGIEAEGPIMNPEARSDVVNGQDDVDDLLSSLGF
ncbi:TPA: protein phosphatase CheZ [Aeromonas veronii]|uniref:protein phosphatase CheZ n=1 Tax=Aeromonas veronii TaxID=654 RepID=UPI00330B7558|nr:protein phosphatase CheZ [Aeromonas veronii]HDO1332842.1 protein phosphatase CheZ [Aeromonas veronii]HDO1337949.1 protein phosphatase CheZ [Aeromonas veronii]HDO1341913.1 protein phosphatase CheZ [Aeromonas veronii]HDO1347665.1 protein phosphatase CheZ [Aeromonas veronii]